MGRPTRGATRYKGERAPVNVLLPTATRERLRSVCQATGLTYADYMEELIRRDELTASGVPVWHPAAAEEPDQQRLELSA